jgi:hypothetical protein
MPAYGQYKILALEIADLLSCMLNKTKKKTCQ